MLFSKVSYAAAAVIAAIPVIMSTPDTIRAIDVKLRPVVRDFTYKPVSFEDGIYRIEVSGYKVSGFCELISYSGFAVSSGISDEVKFQFIDDVTPGNSKPEGWHHFGIWEFDLSSAPSAEHVFLKTVHDCGRWWNVPSVIGPWPIDKSGDLNAS